MDRNLTELLTENPKALRFLHLSYGFDFEKPALIIKGGGRFTHNSICKEISEYIKGKYTAAILLKHTTECWRGNYDEFYMVHVGKGRFEIECNKSLPYSDCNIEWFWTVKDFEDSRKNYTDHYYIIAQADEYLTIPKASSIDLNQRFRYICSRKHGDGRGNSYIGEVRLMMLDGSAQEFKFEPCRYGFYPNKRPQTVAEVIDKSGYIVYTHRHKLERRTRDRKAEKDRVAAAVADFSAEERATEDKTEAIRRELAAQILACVGYEDAKRIENATADLRRALRDLDEHKDQTAKGTYKSVESIKKKLESVNSYLNRCGFILKGETPA